MSNITAVTTDSIQQITRGYGVAAMIEFVFRNREYIVDAEENKCCAVVHSGGKYELWMDYSLCDEDIIEILYEKPGYRGCYCASRHDAIFNHDRINDNMKILLTGIRK